MGRNRSSNIFGIIMGDIYKAQKEHRRGVIYTEILGWVYSDAGYTNPQGFHTKAIIGREGKPISYKYFKAVKNCQLPSMQGIYPMQDSGFSVPYSKCRKCEHFLGRTRGRPKPCCAYLQQIRATLPTAEEETLRILAETVETAKETLL